MAMAAPLVAASRESTRVALVVFRRAFRKELGATNGSERVDAIKKRKWGDL